MYICTCTYTYMHLCIFVHIYIRMYLHANHPVLVPSKTRDKRCGSIHFSYMAYLIHISTNVYSYVHICIGYLFHM